MSNSLEFKSNLCTFTGIFEFCKFEFCHVPELIGVVEKQFTYKKYYNYPLVWVMTFYVGILPSSIWFLSSLREIEIYTEMI